MQLGKCFKSHVFVLYAILWFSFCRKSLSGHLVLYVLHKEVESPQTLGQSRL